MSASEKLRVVCDGMDEWVTTPAGVNLDVLVSVLSQIIAVVGDAEFACDTHQLEPLRESLADLDEALS